MTELITGAKGSAHVTSAQQGAINAYTIGPGAYILDGCAATLPSANTLHIAAGHLMVHGRAIEVTSTDLTIANGTQGTKRHDLACVHYEISEGVETATLTVVQGTQSATPVDPTVSGSILAGDATADIPLWRVSLDGITPTVAAIADVLTPTKTLQDSVSQIKPRSLDLGVNSGMTAGHEYRYSVDISQFGFSAPPMVAVASAYMVSSFYVYASTAASLDYGVVSSGDTVHLVLLLFGS